MNPQELKFKGFDESTKTFTLNSYQLSKTIKNNLKLELITKAEKHPDKFREFIRITENLIGYTKAAFQNYEKPSDTRKKIQNLIKIIDKLDSALYDISNSGRASQAVIFSFYPELVEFCHKKNLDFYEVADNYPVSDFLIMALKSLKTSESELDLIIKAEIPSGKDTTREVFFTKKLVSQYIEIFEEKPGKTNAGGNFQNFVKIALEAAELNLGDNEISKIIDKTPLPPIEKNGEKLFR